MIYKRYLQTPVLSDLKKKMVFLGGPRQVGKTTFAKSLENNYGYLNWDEAEHREAILKGRLPSQKLIVFDELHKYRQWRNWIKGKFDTLRDQHQFLVTGSARLDLYRFGGDSLQGRYFYYRMHPLTVKELKISDSKAFEQLLNLSGFPEPFLGGSQKEYKRWSRDYRTRFFRDDLNSIEVVEDLGSVELLMLRLPAHVGSPLSINSLREDLQKSHKAVARWLDIFERLYGIFRLSPFGSPKIRAVKKEQKHYHFDWALCEEPEQKLENLVASHLLKTAHYLEDTEGEACDLHYFRDTDGREVDFVFLQNKKPKYFVEVKTSMREVSPHLTYLKNRFKDVEAYQVHATSNVDYVNKDGIRVCPAWVFLKKLPV